MTSTKDCSEFLVCERCSAYAVIMMIIMALNAGKIGVIAVAQDTNNVFTNANERTITAHVSSWCSWNILPHASAVSSREFAIEMPTLVTIEFLRILRR